MKSILSTRKKIFSFALLVSVLFLFSSLRPAPALATGSPAPLCNGAAVNASDPSLRKKANCSPPENSGYGYADRDCATNEFPCDDGYNFCRQFFGAQVYTGCWPKGQTTKPAECAPGSTTISARFDTCSDPKYAGKCCKASDFYDFSDINHKKFCANAKDGKPINWCGEIDGNIFPTTDKTYCGSEGTFGYNPETKTCIQGFESKWAKLVFSPCTGGEGVSTAIGCIPTNGPDGLKGFLEFVLKWAFFASGGIIVLMVIATGYTLLTSQGNPEKLQAAKENIVALFSGLILIAFSLVLLQTIGADILKLPTF